MSSKRLQSCLKSSALALFAVVSACTPASAPAPVTVNVDETTGVLTASLGAEGGVIATEASELYAQFGLSFPAGAVPAGTTVTVTPAQDETPLPENAFRVGAQFKLEASAPLAKPVTVRLPVDVAARTGAGSEAKDVKVWVREAEGWKLVEPAAMGEAAVFIELSTLTTVAAGVRSIAATITCSNCPALQLFEPAVGRAPEPCTISGGFCVEPLTGGSVLPAPPPKRIGMHVRRGRVSYNDDSLDNHVVQIRLSDLALFHSQGAVVTSTQLGTTSTSLGTLFSNGRVMTVLPIANPALAARNVNANGPTPASDFISSPTSTSARGLTTTLMRDIDNTGTPGAPITRNTPNTVALLGEDVATPGGSWVVASVSSTFTVGPMAGVIHRVGADGNITASIADLASPQLLVGGCAGGTGGFGDSLSCGIGSGGLFFASNTRLVVRSVNDPSPHKLLMADLTAATPTLLPLNITPPAGLTGEFLNVAVDGQGRVWFIFGSTFSSGLFLFDPANNSTVGVSIANQAPKQLALDGNSVIVFARSTQTAASTIFRVRTFGQ
jgi:hypothetical protein